MNCSTTSPSRDTDDFERRQGVSAPAVRRPATGRGPLARGRGPRVRRPSGPAATCADCAGADAVAARFEAVPSLEPLDLGAGRHVWIGLTTDCATGAVLAARVENLHR